MDWDLVTVEPIWVQWTQRSSSLCWFEPCDLVRRPAGSRRWSLNDAQLVLRGPKSAKKRFPTLLHQHQQPEHLLDGSIHAVYTKLWSYHQNQTKKHVSKPVMSDLCEQVQTAASVSRSSLTGVATGLLLIKSPSFLFWSSPCLVAAIWLAF